MVHVLPINPLGRKFEKMFWVIYTYIPWYITRRCHPGIRNLLVRKYSAILILTSYKQRRLHLWQEGYPFLGGPLCITGEMTPWFVPPVRPSLSAPQNNLAERNYRIKNYPEHENPRGSYDTLRQTPSPHVWIIVHEQDKL